MTSPLSPAPRVLNLSAGTRSVPTAAELGAVDFVLVDGAHDDAFSVVRAVRQVDQSVQIGVLVPDAAARERATRARLLATGAGEIWMVEPAEAATMAARGAEVTQQRRHATRTTVRYAAPGAASPGREPGHLSNAFLAALLDTIPVGVVTIDGQDRVIGWNRMAGRIFGRALETVAGTPVRELFAPDHWEQVSARLRVAEPTDGQVTPSVLRVTVAREDGTTALVEVDAATASAGGLRMRSLVLHDVSDRERLAQQVLQAQRMDAVGRLAGGAAHEINNALQGAIGFAYLGLRRLQPTDPVSDDLQHVLRAGQRAAAITQGLLAFSRRQMLQPSDFELGRLIEEFAPMLRQALGAERVLEIAPVTEPVSVHADRGQLEQVLLNLTLNARDAMAAGGRLTIRLETAVPSRSQRRELGLPGERDGRFAKLEVEDTGAGMNEQTRAQVFEPFFTTKPVGQGTGLGLAVVHGIVHQSGGLITVRSEVGRGTVFTIWLPASASTLQRTPSEPVSPPPGGSERILVVDDDAMVREIAARILSEAGYDARLAKDGDDALRQLEADGNPQEPPVDLVLTDLVMPGLSGRELGERLAARYPTLPVLYMSGQLDDGGAPELRPPPGAVSIRKPFGPDEMWARVREALDGRVSGR